MPAASAGNKKGYVIQMKGMHLERRLAATGAGVLPGHLYVFMHIKTDQTGTNFERSPY